MTYTSDYGWKVVHPINTVRRSVSSQVVISSYLHYFLTSIYHYESGAIDFQIYMDNNRVTSLPSEVNKRCGLLVLVIGEPF